MKQLSLQMAAGLLLFALDIQAAVLYVDLNSASPAAPYTNWATAATNIQVAIDAANPGDQILVTNGIYRTGGRVVYGALTNRVAVTKALTLQSVNGPAVSVIEGYALADQSSQNPNLYLSVRCAYLTNGAVLVGFTLTNGGVWWRSSNTNDANGAGLWCETNAVASNCVFTANSASTCGGAGYQGVYYDCTFVSNSVRYYGGAVYGATLEHCTLAGNSASSWSGGAAHSSRLNNCTVLGNSSYFYGGGVEACQLNNCLVLSNRASGSGSGPCGGGAHQSTLSNCVIAGNTSGYWGGGAYDCSLEHCTVSANYALQGGGVRFGSLVNCTVISNRTLSLGGGAMDATLEKCLLVGNCADIGGGAAFQGMLNNCLVVSNSAQWGAGTAYASLTNCTVVGNVANGFGAGSESSTLANCIVYFNTAPANANCDASILSYCCTSPLPDAGAENFTNAPLFANPGAGDFHLRSDSPCINAGNQTGPPNTADLDGNPRIQGGSVDAGCYEFPNPSMLSYAWLQHYGLLSDGSADQADTDNDGMSNWREWVAGTDPTDAGSVLRLEPPAPVPGGVALTWSSVTNRAYSVEQASSVATSGAFSLLATSIPGARGTTSFTDTNPVTGPRFYRVRVAR